MNTILELENETGKILNSWGTNLFIMPHGLTVDKEDNIWVTDVALNQVFKFNHGGQLIMKLGVPKVSAMIHYIFFCRRMLLWVMMVFFM